MYSRGGCLLGEVWQCGAFLKCGSIHGLLWLGLGLWQTFSYQGKSILKSLSLPRFASIYTLLLSCSQISIITCFPAYSLLLFMCLAVGAAMFVRCGASSFVCDLTCTIFQYFKINAATETRCSHNRADWLYWRSWRLFPASLPVRIRGPGVRLVMCA